MQTMLLKRPYEIEESNFGKMVKQVYLLRSLLLQCSKTHGCKFFFHGKDLSTLYMSNSQKVS